MKNMGVITGKQQICGVIGDPIGHSLSPMIHNQLAQKAKQSMTYVPFPVKTEVLEEAIAGAHALGIRGLNVTMPHKQEVMKYVESIDEWAEKIGAVNTLVYTLKGYKGYNTDYYGVEKALASMGCDYSHKNVAIIGSGGAAYAAALCVAQHAKAIYIFNRTVDNANKLKQHLEKYTEIPIYVYGMDAVLEDTMELVIQTTGIGMGAYAEQMPICTEMVLKGAKYAMDMIYSPWETVFLKYAKQQGITILNGFSMLYYQGIKAYELMNHCEYDEGLSEQIKEEIENFVEFEWTKKDLHL